MFTLPDAKRIFYLEFARETMGLANYSLAGSGVPDLDMRDLDLQAEELLRPVTPNPKGFDSLELLQALADYNHCDPENIMRSTGTSQAIFTLLGALLDRGDEIIVEHPAYEPLWRVPQYLGLEVKRLPRTLGNDWKINFDVLQSLLTPNTKMLLVSNLHNPSGKRISDSEWQQLATFAEEADCYIVSDEVYLDMNIELAIPKRAAMFSDRIISIGSLTKCWGLGPVRAGWIIATPDIIKACYQFRNLSDVFAPVMSEALILACLNRKETLQAGMKSLLTDNMTLLTNWLQQRSDLRWQRPDGGLMIYVQLPEGMSSKALSHYCMDRYKTLFSPGSFFEQDNMARLACGTKPDTLKIGLENLGLALDTFPAESS